MNVFGFGAVGAILAIGIGYLVNQLPPIKERPRTIHWIIIGSLAILGVGSGALAHWEFTAEAAADPIAAIQVPRDGEKIPRPLTVEVRLNKAIPAGRTIWLGYQNELGGPFIVQASECVAIEQRLDCGPLFVGANDKDKAEFRLFIAAADEAATAQLDTIAAAAGAGTAYGMNMSCPRLPAGAQIISETRRVALG